MEQKQSTFEAGSLFKVDGLVAVITGGGTGIGLSIARTLAENGASKVYILGRRLEKLKEAAASSPHDNIIPIQADVTSKDDLERAVSQVTTEVGYINLLICNSGITGPGFITMRPDASPAEFKDYIWQNWTQEEFSKTSEVNVTAVLFTAIAFLELLHQGNKRGQPGDASSQIIVTASVASYMRRASLGFAYMLSKGAVNHMAKILSTQFVRYNIRVNIFNLGTFPSKSPAYRTPGTSQKAELSFAADMTESFIGKVPGFSPEGMPGRRLGNATDLIGATLYLSSKAGSYLNGVSLVIDGGVLSVVPSTY
ncbi:hypothetical protein IL306_006344 [Fusarium sp. DS 682]|nr:hypothetical protein IL306_006344 [Fusarium sp. DS 682]